MRLKELKRIMRENERYALILEEYDKTGKNPLKKTRQSFTIKRMNHERLKKEAKIRRESMSDILDELIEEKL